MATVLIVDDEMYIRMYLRGTLEAMGHQVVGEAGDGLTAIERTRELQPQVVLLDVVMPGADGITILPALHAAAPHAHFVLSTSIDPVRCGVLASCDRLAGFLTKPVHPQDLRRVLARITDYDESVSGVRHPVAAVPG